MRAPRTAGARGLIRTLALPAILLAFVVALVMSPAATAATAAPAPEDRTASRTSDDLGTTIVGGSFVYDSKPYIAALHYNGSFTCTSVIIASQWVLTAAHCVPNNNGYSVRINSLLRSSGGQVVAVTQVVRHPQFNWPQNDIALLRLASAASSSYPMAVSSDMANGQNAVIYGWGSEKPDWSGPLPERLKTATGTVSNIDCVSGSAACTQTNGSVAGGDSGGPAFVQSPSGRWVVAGVCAVGHQPAGSGWAAYTKVANHRTWIRSYAGV